MRGFKAYQIHKAMSLHFNKNVDYDYHKYNGKTSAKFENYISDKHKIIKYSGIEKRVGDDLELFFFSVLGNPITRFIKFVPQAYYRIYKKYSEEIENFPLTFKMDVDKICNSLISDYSLYNGHDDCLHPLLYTWARRSEISQMTMEFIDINIMPFLNEQASVDPILWTDVVEAHNQRKNFLQLCVFCRCNKDELVRYYKERIGQKLK